MAEAIADGAKGEVGVRGWIRRVQVSVQDGDGEASVVEDLSQLEHWIDVALKWQREEEETAVVSLVHFGLCLCRVTQSQSETLESL